MRFQLYAFLSLTIGSVLGSAQSSTTSSSSSSAVDALLAQLALLPECAQTCITTALPAATDCALGDLACLCTNVPFTQETGLCVAANCTIKGALQTERWQKTACGAPVENHADSTRRVVWVLFGLATLAIGFRILARMTFLEGSLGWDDWTCLLGYSFLVPCTVLVQIMTDKGLGQNIWMVSFDDITTVLYYFYIEEYLYIGFVMVTKISIVLLYLRIIPGSVSPRFRIICLVIIGLMVAYVLSFIVALAMQCTPISYSWTQWDGEHSGTCIDLEAQVYAGAICNICWDIIVFVLPIPRLIKLQVRDTRKKVFVVLTFLVGIFGTVCSIIRLRYLTQWGKTSNATMHYNNIGVWSAIEGDVGVICACMPAIAGPVLYFLRTFVGSKIRGSRSKVSGQFDSKGNGAVAQRVPSSAAGDKGGAGGHVNTLASQKSGGISKTVTASMYNMPYEAHSDDDVELMGRHHAQGVGDGRGGWYRHDDYAGSWR